MKEIIDDELIRDILQDGVSQVDEELVIDTFECEFDTSIRKLMVHFTATNSKTQETIEFSDVMG